MQATKCFELYCLYDNFSIEYTNAFRVLVALTKLYSLMSSSLQIVSSHLSC